MEFNHATLFKVPFDNTYKNVVDYHTYTKTGTTLTKTALSQANIKQCRSNYFSSLAWHNIYFNHSKNKSVKITGKYVQFSIAGKWYYNKDYNYVRLQRWEEIEGVDTIVDELFCFVNSMDSNNDSSAPSTTIYAEIDFWTQYIDRIEMNTPEQYEMYAHEYVNVYNGKKDDRIPSEFISRNTFNYLFTDFILFIKIAIDRSYFGPQYTTTRGRFDPAGGVLDYVYVPFMAVYKTGNVYHYELITGYEYLDTAGTASTMDRTSTIKQYGYFGFYDDERMHDAKLTPFTPFGVLKATDFTRLVNGKRHFVSNVNMFWIDSGNNYVLPFTYQIGNVTYKHYIYVPGTLGNLFSMGAIFASDNSSMLPVDNLIENMSYNFSATDNKNILSSYSFLTEAKFKQYPYETRTLIYNGTQYNITPEPTGSSTTPYVTIYLKLLNSLKIEVNNRSNIGDVFSLVLTNDPSIPISADVYKSYALKQLDADMMKLTVSSLGSIATVIAGMASANPMLIIGGATAGAGALANIGGSIQTASQTPDVINNPSNNAFDNIYTSCPIVKSSILKEEDYQYISSIWRRNGYPIKEYRSFTMKRFWYDYKQIKSCTMPIITNALARETIERALNNGVVIWHANNVGNTIKISTINNFSINNPSNTDCTEVT